MARLETATERPSSPEEAAALLRALGEDRRAVRVRGGATKLDWGGSGEPVSVELETGDLDAIVEHNVGDFTAVLQAGVPLARAQEAFRAEGQMLALDPPLTGPGTAGTGGGAGRESAAGRGGGAGREGAAGRGGEAGREGAAGRDGEAGREGAAGRDGEAGREGAGGRDGEAGHGGDSATVGGVVATADSGPLRHRYGGVRDLIVGITVALSDGTLAKAGGKVIKNVAGYDLGKLFAGSFGTLGLIVQVAVRLHPHPETTATVMGFSDDPDTLAAAARTLAALPLEADCLDARWEAGAGALLVRFGGTAAPHQAEVTVARVRAAGLHDVRTVEDDDELWARQRVQQRAGAAAASESGGSGAVEAARQAAAAGTRTPSHPAAGTRTPSHPAAATRTPSDPAAGTRTPSDPAAATRTPRDPAQDAGIPGGAAEGQGAAPGEADGRGARAGAVLKVSGRPGELAAVCRAADEAGGRLVGRAALGLSWIVLDGDDLVARLERVRTVLAPRACVLLDAPPAVRAAVDPWGAALDPGALAVMARVKERFDPARVLRPGAFVGGI